MIYKTRIERRSWTNKDIGFKSSGGMFDLMDNAIKVAYRITDDEYDFICKKATDQELESLLNENPSFSQKKEMLNIIHKYTFELLKQTKHETKNQSN